MVLFNRNFLLCLKFFTVISFVISVLIPHGYYESCRGYTSVGWFESQSILFYLVIFYLLLSFFIEFLKFGYMTLLFDCFIFLYLVQYVFIDAMLTPIFGGGVTLFLDRIFGSIFGGLAGKEGCGADIIFHYQWGYFFYITAVGSFFLSTILGLVTFLRNRKG